MKLGQLDLDTRFKYLIVYKDKKDDTINTWTLGEGGFELNYELMQKDENVEFLGIYQKLSDKQLLELMCK